VTKYRSKSRFLPLNFIKEGFIKEENTFHEGISLPRRRPSLLDPFDEITGLLQIERNFLVEWVVRTIFYEGISLRKKLSEKIARFSTQKIDAVTGVTVANWVSFDFNVSYSSY